MGYSTYNGFGPKIRAESFAWMKARIASGAVPPPRECQACGETRGHIDYHTEDYSKPFGPHIHAYELCFRCHMICHLRFRKPDVWLRYIEQLERGAVYAPLMSRAEIGQVNVPGWVERPIAFGEPRPTQTFFRSLTVTRADAVQPLLFD
jgi:hypothetical protein